MARIIYKICDFRSWQIAEASGHYRGSAVDLRDGFIHFSAPDQVIETAARHFAGMNDLVLLAVDADRLGPNLKWERSRGGALFPHFCGELALDAVIAVTPLERGHDGALVFPAIAE